VASGDPEVPKYPFPFNFKGVRLSPHIRFKGACNHAQRTGDLSRVIALLRSYHPLDKSNQDRLADLLERAKLKRPPGNPRGPDGWVAFATRLARDQKQELHRNGWKKSKGVGDTIDDVSIDSVIAFMREEDFPMRPNEAKFKGKVRTKLRRSKGGAKITPAEALASDAAFTALASRQPRKRK
jgi:hypothetical protein